MTPDKQCDILIIGAGQVGSTMARQLRLQQPDLKITQIDKKNAFDMWVGEAMTESWDDYMIRHLKLGRYLEMHTLQKHGLRFLFDSADKDLPLWEMSEFGRDFLHNMTARLMDRARFDRDMVEINRESGIEVLLGTRVLGRKGEHNIHIDPEEGHLVETSAGTIRCRWLIDAGGRSSPLATALDLVEPPDERHPIGSYWGRFKGFQSMDDLGSEEWRARINHTQRYLSATTFMNDGYWLWHIPVSDTVTSIGVVFHHELHPLTIKNADQFEAFLRKHRCMRDILGDDSQSVDFMGLKRLARTTRKQYSEDRWYLTGMSAVFLDPIGATNSWLYPQQNKFIGFLIDADRKGQGDKVRRYIRYFETHLRRLYEGLLDTFGHYDLFGAYDLQMPYLGARLSAYFNTVLSADQTDFRTFLRLIDEFGDDEEEVWKRLSHPGYWDAVLKITYEMRDYLKSKDSYLKNNSGAYQDQRFWENRPAVLDRMYGERGQEVERSLLLESHQEFLRLHAKRYAELEGVAFDEDAFRAAVKPDWNDQQGIADLIEAMGKQQGNA